MNIVADVPCSVAWRLQSIHSQLPQLGGEEDDDDKTIASFPGLHCFLFFGLCPICSSTSVYYTEHNQKNKKQGRPGKEANEAKPEESLALPHCMGQHKHNYCFVCLQY